jgi:hypothetical protein
MVKNVNSLSGIYFTYTSKWNPVEHKAFPHITRAMQGVVLTRVYREKLWRALYG